MGSLADDIAKIEYDRLSKEMASMFDENNQFARYAVIAAAAICTAMVTQHDHIKPYYWLLKYLPFLISILFTFRIYALYRRLELISLYLEKHIVEQHLKPVHQDFGWETHLNRNIGNKYEATSPRHNA